jgi:hypothetical protein
VTHLDEEQVQRVLLGELTRAAEEAARAHLAACTTCREQVAAAEREENEIHALLGTLDHEPPAIHVRAFTTAAAHAARSSRAAWRRRAAGLLVALGVAGAAYALPGSPVPGWVDSVVERLGSLAGSSARRPATPAPAATEPAPGPQEATTESRSGIAVDPGISLLILFTRAEEEGQVEVVLSDGVAVQVLAPPAAASFTSDVNLLRIENASGAARFRIEVPRAAPRVEIRVAGKRIFLKEGPRITAEPAAARGSYVLPLAP